MDTTTLVTHVPAELADKLDGFMEEKRHLMTLEALDDVDNGRLISHQAVMEWAASLSTEQLPLPTPKK